jgi:hypothetical protein
MNNISSNAAGSNRDGSSTKEASNIWNASNRRGSNTRRCAIKDGEASNTTTASIVVRTTTERTSESSRIRCRHLIFFSLIDTDRWYNINFINFISTQLNRQVYTKYVVLFYSLTHLIHIRLIWRIFSVLVPRFKYS